MQVGKSLIICWRSSPLTLTFAGLSCLETQEGLAYRDIPQTTYTRLIASGAGEKIPTPSQARRGGKGKAKKDPDDLLLPLDGCDALLYTLPADLRETLLPFQRDGVLYGLRRKGRCLIADEMGTGKVGTATIHRDTSRQQRAM